MATSAKLLDVQNLNAYYGHSQILHDVSIGLDPGEIVTVLGRNGVGKTTLVHSIVNFGPRVEGTILFDNKNIVGLPSYKIVQMGLGIVPSDRRVFRDLTVMQNLLVANQPANPLGYKWTVQDTLDLFPELAGMVDRLGWQLSGGEQQMLSIARTLLTCPRLLLLDEPSEGLSPLVVQRLGGKLKAIAEAGVGVLLVEQNSAFALSVATRGYVLETGQVKISGTAQEIREHPDFVELLAV